MTQSVCTCVREGVGRKIEVFREVSLKEVKPDLSVAELGDISYV